FVPQVTKKEELVFQIKTGSVDSEKLLKRAPRQRAILELLKDGSLSSSDLKAKGAYSRTALQGLLEKKLIDICREEIARNPLQERLQNVRPLVLNPDQKQACVTICNNLQTGNRKWLLFGITGSGKTEVYLRVMEEVLKKGKQVLYLVPEISLTPQIVSLLVEVFGEKVAILHSALSAGERYEQWIKIRDGQARVVLGPRSAVFAPFTALGLIIIDEEHENTYKQNEPDPRYDARRVAEKLVELWGATLIMGSATPSLRSFYLAKKGEYSLLQLPHRVASRPLPAIEIVDLKEELRTGNRSIFSKKLLESLQRVLTEGEQAILFMNRRGFHTYVMCRECGKPLTCPHCSITLIYHHAQGRLVCHYCHYQRPIPRNCAYCGSSYVRYYGTGTERVAAEFANFFPGVPFLRMDTDTTQRKDSHMQILKEFQEGRAQVLIGTQMIAKGLDFPEVTLVGIVNPDFLLNMPDYQAGERAYQLMTQVAGRAGRGEKSGQVIIQTYDAEHYLFSSVVRQNYEEFFQQEIANRKILQYPPFLYLARIMVSGYNERKVVQRIQHWIKILQSENLNLKADAEFLGPGAAPLGFLKKRFRYHIIIKSTQLKVLQSLTRQVRERDLKNSGEPRTIIDLEPQSLL
ncbi:MAG: primosomal protein N', partial [Clostridia bacterium]|nr:primosomal protein N' [Clostridia bacterium]